MDFTNLNVDLFLKGFYVWKLLQVVIPSEVHILCKRITGIVWIWKMSQKINLDRGGVGEKMQLDVGNEPTLS